PAESTLQPLQQALRNDYYEVRAAAATLLKAFAVSPFAETALQLLQLASKDGDEGVRRAVAESMGAFAATPFAESALQLLQQALRDEDEGVRRAVAESMGAFAATPFAERALQLVQQALKDKNDYVHQVAAASLVAFATTPLAKKAFKTLQQLLKNQDNQDTYANVVKTVVDAIVAFAIACPQPELYQMAYQSLLASVSSRFWVRLGLRVKCIAGLVKLTEFHKDVLKNPLVTQLSHDVEYFKKSYFNEPLFSPKTQPVYSMLSPENQNNILLEEEIENEPSEIIIIEHNSAHEESDGEQITMENKKISRLSDSQKMTRKNEGNLAVPKMSDLTRNGILHFSPKNGDPPSNLRADPETGNHGGLPLQQPQHVYKSS
ncbi:MAG: HEAT repeat domain-containing protein, partial [Gammaproteobacteria bacterium]|nr:HEAT repeat domain-containing protein [Gammaproteobacteria bacterium]